MLSEDIKTQQKINELQKEKHKIDIEYKNKELITTTMHVVNKNKVLDDIKKIIKKEMEAESFSKANLQKIINEINFNINLDKDWNDFKMHFEVVNTNFFDRLQKQYPKLTQNDLKLCAYMRMNLSSKEIAQIMNITLSAINKSRNRLRKKMNLDSNINLTQYMAEY
jgi:DNA-binding CsgD family transcriptional regulator